MIPGLPEPIEEPIEPVEPAAMEAAEHGGNVVQMPLQPQQRAMAILNHLVTVPNVATELDDNKLAALGTKVVREYKLDDDSRADWRERARRAMDMAKQKREAKSFPWPDASNVKYPLLTTAALQFAARAYPAIVDGPRIVKCKVLGADPTGMKAAAADRVSQHMSYQLMVELPSWEDDMDTLLHQLPIVGCAFKKIFPDQSNAAGFGDEMVSAFDFVVNQSAKSLETVPRATHVFRKYPHEIAELQRSGWYLDIDLGRSSTDGNDEDAPHTILEQHRWEDIDGDGVREPWVVTVHEQTGKVLRIKACFDLEAVDIDPQTGKLMRIKRKDYFVKVPFIPDPEGGFYDVGFGHLLEPMLDVIDTTINSMMDAATLQNAGGGFVAAGVQLGNKATIRIRPGEYKTVQSAGNDIRQAVVNHQHPGPSPVLFELLGMMIESGKDIAAIKDVLVGEAPKSGQTATATMAIIEQGLKVFTAIYKRIYRALGKEYRLIFDINKRTLNQARYVALLDQPVQVVGADYQGELDVMPVSDPGMITDMQRMAKAQFVLEEAKSGNPHINMFEATRRAFDAARIEDVQALLVPPEPKPQDAIMAAGAAAEVELKMAQTDKTRADADLSAANAAAARAQSQIPLGIPIPIPEPQFTPPHLMPMPGQDQPPMPGGQPMGPEAGMMGADMGAPSMMPPPEQNPLIGMVPEIAQPETMLGEPQ